MAELSRERIAEIRADAEAGHWVRHDPALVLALLDAYEAQRPRPASEVPDDERTILICDGAAWCAGHYSHQLRRWIKYDDGWRSIPDAAVRGWLPMPAPLDAARAEDPSVR